MVKKSKKNKQESKSNEQANPSERKINKETDRKFLTWSHYSFRLRLLHKAALTGSRVVLRSEEYTSQTCDVCGWQHAILKGSKIFHCPNPECTVQDCDGQRCQRSEEHDDQVDRREQTRLRIETTIISSEWQTTYILINQLNHSWRTITLNSLNGVFLISRSTLIL